jgi:hypothetical protein
MEVGGCKMGVVGRVREKRVKTQTSEGKVMVCVFWDSGGILLLEFLEIGATVTSERVIKGVKTNMSVDSAIEED